MKTSRLSVIVPLAITCLAACAVYRNVLTGGSSSGVLHPVSLYIANRPQFVPGDVVQVFPERAPSQIAILLTTPEENGESPVRCLQAMGIPFFVTRDLRTALGHKLLLLYPEVDGKTYDAAEAQAISDFVAHGGVIFAQNVFWGGFKTLFGFEDVVPLRTRHKIVFDMTHPEATDATLRYLNRAAEQEVPLGSSAIPEVIWSNGYKAASGTRSLARFEDGSTAVLRHDVGRGHTYLIGVALNDVVRRNQQNRDYEAQRIYVNGFEPGTDVWLLLLRAWYEIYSDSGIRLGTIPEGKRSVLMLSHDVDWEHSFQPMLAFAAFEKSAGTSSTFFVQTKYLDDANSHAFFFGQSLDILREVAAGKSDIGSHTVIHTKLFNKVPLGTGGERYPSYHARATRDNAAQDATALGEVCVSKSLLDGEIPAHETIFFRAGHLRVPPFLPEALVRCGYEFDSSFTAGDVLTNFPYRLDFDLGMTEPTPIFEFPVTFEDEQLPPLMDRIPAMLDVIKANAENGAPSVILIHSNNAQDKLEAERVLLSRLPNDILVENMTEYARFWKARSRVSWVPRPAPGGAPGEERIEINSELAVAGLTLVSPHTIQNASGMPGIRWTDHEVILPGLAAKSQVFIRITYSRN
ncbi:MAG: hypothetical protein ACLPHP_11050 [Candidatus Sulfotelmatobacter sp.]